MMRYRVGSRLAILFCACTGVGSAEAQSGAEAPAVEVEELTQEEMDQHEIILDERLQRIEAELAAEEYDELPDDHWAHTWAGMYYTGDGLGMNVRIYIAPNSGVTYTWHGCMGLYDLNYGDITETHPNGLSLDLAIDPERGYNFMDERLYFVKWGPVRYLVPESKMLEFVNNYNQGGNSRSRMYGIPVANGKPRWGIARDETLPTQPTLPEQWAKMLLHESISFNLTSIKGHKLRNVVGDVWRHKYDVEFDAGSENGLYKGMEFRYSDESMYSGYIALNEVEETTCSGELVFFEDKDPPTTPEVGYEFKLPEEIPEWQQKAQPE